MKKLRGKDIAVFVLVLGILFAGVACFIGHGPSVTSASAAMTPEELAAENEALMKQFEEAGRSIGGIAVFTRDEAALKWLEKYAPDGHPSPLPKDDPKAVNEGLKKRVADARVIFETMQASEKKEDPWLRKYYGEENELTLKKLGIKSLKVKEAQNREIETFLKPARTTAKALKGFLSKHASEIAKDKNYNLASVMDTPEHILEMVKPYLEEDVDYSDSRFSFHGNNKEWWVGYRLDGLSDELRKQIVEEGYTSYRDLYRAPDKGKGITDMNTGYNGGDIVFLNVNVNAATGLFFTH